MKRQHHYLKIETEYYQLQEKGIKTFEVRRNDRNYRKGDMVYLKEVVQGVETGRALPGLEIVYVLHGGQYGIEEGYCVLQLQPENLTKTGERSVLDEILSHIDSVKYTDTYKGNVVIEISKLKEILKFYLN